MIAEIRSLVSNIVKLSYISIVVEHFGVFYLWIEYVVAVDMYAWAFFLPEQLLQLAVAFER